MVYYLMGLTVDRFNMKKQELTEELKEDLKAIKLRSHIYSNKFYKGSGSSKLSPFVQIGTVVDDLRSLKDERLTKKQRKARIAEQFMEDDEAQMFSKRKYETAADRKRRMGIKKRDLKASIKRAKKNKKLR